MKLMFSSKTARGLFTDSKNNSHELFMFRLHVGSKPRLKPRGNTDGTSRVPRFQSLSTQSMVRPHLEYSSPVMYGTHTKINT